MVYQIQWASYFSFHLFERRKNIGRRIRSSYRNPEAVETHQPSFSLSFFRNNEQHYCSLVRNLDGSESQKRWECQFPIVWVGWNSFRKNSELGPRHLRWADLLNLNYQYYTTRQTVNHASFDQPVKPKMSLNWMNKMSTHWRKSRAPWCVVHRH